MPRRVVLALELLSFMIAFGYLPFEAPNAGKGGASSP
jgi:hypothetical protein